MWIRRITADNFKSLVGFKLDLSKFTCLVGLNGAGKSTVLQFIDFLTRQVRGDIGGWLRARGWDVNDIGSQLTKKTTVGFSVYLADNPSGEATWEGNFDPSQHCCTQERIAIGGDSLDVRDGKVAIRSTSSGQASEQEIAFTYEGSILSQLREQPLPSKLVEFKRFFRDLHPADAYHVADGVLRLIAILAETQTQHSFLLFDEIENGISPELMEFMLDTLVNTPQQVLMTTHSPMILNYLDDNIARESVVYLYKTRKGHTQAIRFFDIPSVAEKLTVMGPGEAFADTDLTALRDEIENL